jgi:hypothetical protein
VKTDIELQRFSEINEILARFAQRDVIVRVVSRFQ